MFPRTLPIFPLPLVLFPGVTLPLHIFEPRYRQMLVDCMAADRRFGLVYLPEGKAERALESGWVGTVARIEATESLPDGRSNIVVEGDERFALGPWVDSGAPYHVAQVAAYDDEVEPSDEQERLADDVRARFKRVARAARTLEDDSASVPELPDDPSLVGFRVASLIDLDLDTRQRLLASRSSLGRLREIDAVLTAATEELEQRAAVHARAKRNGKGPSGVTPEVE